MRRIKNGEKGEGGERKSRMGEGGEKETEKMETEEDYWSEVITN